jgi:choline dehydrogenase-like flavoprotein
MIEDGRRLEEGVTLTADILIVGAGIAGLTLALTLARKAPQLSILVTEAGGKRCDFKEQAKYFAGGSESHPGHPPLELYRRRMLGGTSSIWGGRCIAMSRDDFLPRPDIGRAGWPIIYEDVAQHYPAALEILEAGANEFHASEAFPNLSETYSQQGRRSGLELDQLERFSPPTDFAKRYAKELDAFPNVKILTNAACVEILTDPSGDKVEGISLRSDDNIFTAKAHHVVIAAGGLETPRLMLWSRKSRPSGLGNQSNQLGRHYMTHYVGDLGHIRFAKDREPVSVDYSKSHDGVWCRRLLMLDEKTRRENRLLNFVIRPTIPAISDPAHGSAVLSAAYFSKRFLVPEYARRLAAMPVGPGPASKMPWLGHARNLITGLPELVRFTSTWTRQRILPRRKLPSLFLPSKTGLYPLDFNVEEIADAGSRLKLGEDTDQYGMPRLSLSWRVAPNFPRKLLKIYDIFGERLRASGIGEIEVSELEREQVLDRCYAQGGHHMGTARMSGTSSTGVVDQNLQVWGTRGLYVLGSAVFPTCGFANPTLTIVALSLRLAETLTDIFGRNGEKPVSPSKVRAENTT